MDQSQSQPNPAPVTEAAPAPTEAPPAETPVSRLRQLMAERYPDKPKAEEAKPTEAPAEAKPPEATEEAKPAEKPRLELKLAQTQSELRKLTSESTKLKETYKTTQAELESFKSSFADNPLRALEKATGKSLQEIFEAAKRGDYDDAATKLPPEIQSKLSYLDQLQAREQEREAQDQKRQAEAQRESEKVQALPKLQNLLDSDSSKYPYLSTSTDAAAVLADEIYARIDRGEEVDVPTVMAELDGQAKAIATYWLSQTALVKNLLTDEKLKTTLIEALGVSAPDKQNPPQSVSRMDKKPPATVSTLTEVKSRSESTRNRTQEIAEEWSRARGKS